MSKNRNREKSLLNKFKDFTDDTILNLLKSGIPEYEILVKSEQKAIKILVKYGITVYPTLNENQKQRIEKLLEVAKLRKLTIPTEWYLVTIAIDDVIARIEEFKCEEISWIDEHNYLFDAVNPDFETKNLNIINSSSCNYSSEEAIEKVYRVYDKIIAEQKENKCNLNIFNQTEVRETSGFLKNKSLKLTLPNNIEKIQTIDNKLISVN